MRLGGAAYHSHARCQRKQIFESSLLVQFIVMWWPLPFWVSHPTFLWKLATLLPVLAFSLCPRLARHSFGWRCLSDVSYSSISATHQTMLCVVVLNLTDAAAPLCSTGW